MHIGNQVCPELKMKIYEAVLLLKTAKARF